MPIFSAQLREGIVFSFKYGMEIMEGIGIHAKVIRAGKANMFLSPLFRETLAGISGATIEMYDTDGSIGAARGAGIGSGYFASAERSICQFEQTGDSPSQPCQQECLPGCLPELEGPTKQTLL